MIDPKDLPSFSGGGGCFVHDHISFPIDEECPICLEQEDCEIAGPYIDRMKILSREILRLKKKLSEVSYIKGEL